MKPTDLGLPSKFAAFRSYPGFDQFRVALDLATTDTRFQITNAATGAGKSLLYSATAALKQSRWLALVGTKGLQAQLLGDGLVECSIVGHRNYPCASRLGIEDADADDPAFQCAVPRDRCQYRADIAAANDARSVVTNYAYWLAVGRYGDPGILGDFDFLVLDEAHGTPSWLTDSLAITMSSRRLYRLLDYSRPLPRWPKIEEWREWAEGLLPLVAPRLARCGKGDERERRKLERLIGDLERLSVVSDPAARDKIGLREPWIVIPEDARVRFSPRWGADFGERYLFRGIPSTLLTSATVTRQHATYLGVPETESRYLEIPSPFDPRRRPVIWVPTVRVDYRMSDGARYKLARRVDELIAAAIDQGAGNGVLFTASYEQNREIVRGSQYAAAIISHRQDSQEFSAALERFKDAGRRGRFAVFASPRIQEGIDLIGDLARWGVILKCMPGIDTRDPLVAARAKDPAYRDMVVMESVYQKCGRIVRANDDFGTIVVIDDHWSHVRRLPFARWFKEAFGVVDDVSRLRFLTKDKVAGFGPRQEVKFIGIGS